MRAAVGQPGSLEREGWPSKCGGDVEGSEAGHEGSYARRAVPRGGGSCGVAVLRITDTWKRMVAHSVSTWWEVHCGAALKGHSALVAPADSAAPVWSRMCPGECNSLPGQPPPVPFPTGCSSPGTSPKPLLQPSPQGPLAFSGSCQCIQGLLGHSPVPVTSESNCATDQSRMRVQEGLEAEADSSMLF